MPLLMVFFGMTAVGKSTLARDWAERCHAPWYNTDRIRKELAGLQVTEKRPDAVGQGIYSPVLTAKTYQFMLDQACLDFSKGAQQVVLDGSYSCRDDRDRVRAFAIRQGLCCLFVWCVCEEETVRQRLALRAQDPEAVSDGRLEIYLHQRKNFMFPDVSEEKDCICFETEEPLAILLQRLAAQTGF